MAVNRVNDAEVAARLAQEAAKRVADGVKPPPQAPAAPEKLQQKPPQLEQPAQQPTPADKDRFDAQKRAQEQQPPESPEQARHGGREADEDRRQGTLLERVRDATSNRLVEAKDAAGRAASEFKNTFVEKATSLADMATRAVQQAAESARTSFEGLRDPNRAQPPAIPTSPEAAKELVKQGSTAADQAQRVVKNTATEKDRERPGQQRETGRRQRSVDARAQLETLKAGERFTQRAQGLEVQAREGEAGHLEYAVTSEEKGEAVAEYHFASAEDAKRGMTLLQQQRQAAPSTLTAAAQELGVVSEADRKFLKGQLKKVALSKDTARELGTELKPLKGPVKPRGEPMAKLSLGDGKAELIVEREYEYRGDDTPPGTTVRAVHEQRWALEADLETLRENPEGALYSPKERTAEALRVEARYLPPGNAGTPLARVAQRARLEVTANPQQFAGGAGLQAIAKRNFGAALQAAAGSQGAPTVELQFETFAELTTTRDGRAVATRETILARQHWAGDPAELAAEVEAQIGGLPEQVDANARVEPVRG